MITTTTLGAYPKPADVPISDWFAAEYAEDRSVAYTARYEGELEAAGGDAETRFVRATQQVLADQIDAGIDVVTDGEVRRENYVHYQCRHLGGIDFDQLRPHRLRGAIETFLPSVTGPIVFESSPLVHDFQVAQSISARPVKATLPGPMTIRDTTVDSFYGNDRALGADLAAALNTQILDLAAAGCMHIQVDEPLMARRPDVAADYGIEQLGRCFDGVPASVVTAVHCCCGYPRHLDDDDYPKAGRAAYIDLVPMLDELRIDQISIEDAHRHNDLAELLPLFRSTALVLGVVAIASSRVETVDQIASRLQEARKFLPDDRIVAAPDCGLGYLGRDLAVRKLTNLSAAVRLINHTI